MTWTMIMAQQYPPGSLKFERPSDAKDRTAFQTSAIGWDDVLAGSALSTFRRGFLHPDLAKNLREFASVRKRLGG